MPRNRPAPTPHRIPVDLAPLKEVTVLGESVAVLFSGLLRLEISDRGDGMANLTGTMLGREGNALVRAMTRADRPIPGDLRTVGERDADRLMTVVERVSEVMTAVTAAAGP